METRLRRRSKAKSGGIPARRLRDPLLAAIVTAAIYWLVMFWGDYVPFGINTPAVTDAKLQYLDLFSYYRDVLTGQNSAVYTFSNTLGGSTAAIWAYYLASPFNLLVLLFPKDQMNLFLEVLITVKLGAASASFAWFTGRRFPDKISRDMTLLLSVGYGLMQYMLAQGSNVMWLDGVILLPFLILGVHSAARSGSFSAAKLAVPAALTVFANWYTGGINYLFAAVWFVYELLRRGISPKKGKDGRPAWNQAAGRFLLGMGTGLLLAAVLFLPNVIALRQGKAGSWNPMDVNLSPGFRGNPLSVIRSYRIGEMSDLTRTSFFCGTPAAFGAAAFFFSGRIAGREKLAVLVPVIIAWMSCFWKPLFYVFSLFMRNTSYWYRFGYLGSFVLLYLAAYWAGSLPGEGGFADWKRWSVIPKAGGTCLLLVLISRKVWPSGGSGSTRTALFMLTAMTLFMGYRYAPDKALRVLNSRKVIYRRRRILASLLLALGLWEAFLETRTMLKIYHTDTAEEYASYSREEQAQIREIKELGGDDFYRISQTSTRITNIDGLTGAYLDAMAYGYASINGYTSCPENIQLEFLDRIGYRKEYDSFNIVNISFLPADSLLGVRYVLSPYEIPGLERIEEAGVHNKKAVYRNLSALPAAMILEESGAAAPKPPQRDPFAYTEYLFSRIAGEEAGLWTPVEAEKTGRKGVSVWKLRPPAAQEAKYCLYGNLPWTAEVSFDDPQWWDEAQEQGKLTLQEGWSFGYGGWLSPSVFYIPVEEETGTAEVMLETRGEMELRDEQFFALDLERLAQLAARIRQRADSVTDLKISNGKITCTVEAKEGQKLLLSVPASRGWTARVNGQKIQIEAFEGALTQISLFPGENHITMQYRTPGLAAGLLLSLTGAGILAVSELRSRKRGKV